jgi:hypothetical protein
MSSAWLRSRAHDVQSQNGEDGILRAIFEIIGTTNRWCVEFGAWDGVRFSNTWDLLRNHGWSGVLIEADPKRFRDLRRNRAALGDPVVLCRKVGFESPDTLDEILSETPIPAEFDLLSVDVDGEDYRIWRALRRYRPRVVVIEVDSTHPPERTFVPDVGKGGASIAAMVELGREKGYELVLHTGNAIFVRREDAPRLGVEPERWADLFDRSWLPGGRHSVA